MSEPSGVHEVKCWPSYFELLKDGTKTFEVRLNDRDYREGDSLILNEWDPQAQSPTGQRLFFTVGHVFSGGMGCDMGAWVILSLLPSR